MKKLAAIILTLLYSSQSHATEAYLTLTTSPERLSAIPAVLRNLKDLIATDVIEKIFINLPEKYRNQIEYNEKLVSKLEKNLNAEYHGKIFLIRTKKDLGPITKLLPAIRYLKQEGKLDSVVVSIDDDHLYSSDVIQKLIEDKKNHKDLVISAGGGALYHWAQHWGAAREDIKFPDLIWKNNESKKTAFEEKAPSNEKKKLHYGVPVDLVEGYAGVAYSPEDLDDELLEYLSEDTVTSKDCRLSDDMVISFVLALNGHPRMMLFNLPYPLSLNLADGLKKGSGYTKEELKRSKTSPYEGYDSRKYRKCLNDLVRITYNPTSGHFRDSSTVKKMIQTFLTTRKTLPKKMEKKKPSIRVESLTEFIKSEEAELNP